MPPSSRRSSIASGEVHPSSSIQTWDGRPCSSPTSPRRARDPVAADSTSCRQTDRRSRQLMTPPRMPARRALRKHDLNCLLISTDNRLPLRSPANRVEEQRFEGAVLEQIGFVSELEVHVPCFVVRI